MSLLCPGTADRHRRHQTTRDVTLRHVGQGSALAEDVITPGTILIAKETERPEFFQLDDCDSAGGWTPLKHHLGFAELDRELAAKGWTFFYFANSITATVFGLDRAKMLRSAVARLIGNVKLRKCNCLEIDTVSRHSFLGIPYVNVSGHPRHIQKGMVFSGE